MTRILQLFLNQLQMIQIHQKCLIWDAKGIHILSSHYKIKFVFSDAVYLRREKRIVGCLIGTSHLRPSQNGIPPSNIYFTISHCYYYCLFGTDELLLPLFLLPEEASFLVESGKLFPFILYL
jgi:hypothetical protein